MQSEYYQLMDETTFRLRDVICTFALREGDFRYSWTRTEEDQILPIDYVLVHKNLGWKHISEFDFKEINQLLLSNNIKIEVFSLNEVVEK